jgi:hypothetical protein
MIVWSVPVEVFGGRMQDLEALNLDATEFKLFAELTHV